MIPVAIMKKRKYNRTLADKMVRRIDQVDDENENEDIEDTEEVNDEIPESRRINRVRRVGDPYHYRPQYYSTFNNNVPINMDLVDAMTMPYNPNITFYPGSRFPRGSYLKVRRAGIIQR